MNARASRGRLGVAIGMLATMLAAGPALARDRHPIQLLSKSAAGGGVPNAPAVDPAISGDFRINRYAAYASKATDIAAGTDGHENVYLVKRARPWSSNGSAWHVGATSLISRGLGGPANGDSFGPSFDGYDGANSKCMAFVSTASNLVRGDGNGHADVFVKHLPNGRLHRIPTKGAASQASIDGRCRNVAYIANGTVYLAKTSSKGKARRMSARGGASFAHIQLNGRFVTYQRNGAIYRGRHRITNGTNPSPDGYGHNIAFQRGGTIFKAQQTGAAHVHRLADGAEPSMTVGGSFVFYASGPFVRNPVYSTTMGTCPIGEAHQPQGSSHGNYDVFACSGGPVFLHYVGGK